MTAPLHADVDWRGVSPRLVRARILSALATCALPTAVCAVLALTVSPWWWFLAVPFGLGLVLTPVLAPVQVPAIRWTEREWDVVIVKGWITRSTTVVPYHRVQDVALEEGPIAQRLGLAKIELRTAASMAGADLPGLPLPDAQALRDRLVARGVVLRDVS